MRVGTSINSVQISAKVLPSKVHTPYQLIPKANREIKRPSIVTSTTENAVETVLTSTLSNFPMKEFLCFRIAFFNCLLYA